MARVYDDPDNQEIKLEENEELGSFEEEVSNPEVEQDLQANDEVTEEPIEAKSEVPEKYKDKSLEDIVRMHQEAEKLLGRQSSEVGDLRKSVDELLRVKVDEAAEEVEPELDFYDDPRGSVSRAVEGSETVKQMKELLERQQQQDVLGKIGAKHPNYEDTIKDGKFIDWIKASAVRTELLQRADNYDFNAADELLSNWKGVRGAVDKEESLNGLDRKQQVKAASTGGRGSGEPLTRKIYKRSDIVNLKAFYPEKFEKMSDEIEKAYREGRVK
jgi:hypothetical protein